MKIEKTSGFYGPLRPRGEETGGHQHRVMDNRMMTDSFFVMLHSR